MPLEEKIEYIGYEPIDIDKIKIDKDIQARLEKIDIEIDDLVDSIKRVGLLEPILVSEEKKGEEYKLIVGQRRLLALIKLKEKKIPARIIKPINPLLALTISFGENLQRRDITQNDKSRVASKLFELYPGTDQEKLQKISKDLGVKPSTVIRYIQYGAVPDEVKKLVDEKKLSSEKAWQLTAALLGNAQKIIEAAKKMAEENMSNPERENIIQAAKELGPSASMPDIMKRARQLPPRVKVHIHLDESIVDELEQQRKKRGFERKEDLIVDIIEQYIKNEGLK